MDWQQVTQSFLPLTREQTSAFASPREMDLAIATYNRAIRNLSQDSADIALITLRRLASSYPDFQEASLLYGCCLARTGELAAAREQLLCAGQMPNLAPDLAEAAAAALQMVEADLATAASQPDARNGYIDSVAEQLAAADLPPGTAPVVLERTGRRRQMRMASERERRDVLRQSDSQQPEETRVVMPRTSFETVQTILPIAAVVLAIALLAVIGFRFLPGLLGRQNQANAGAEERLTYLLTQLEGRAAQDPGLQRILADYNQRFEPGAQATGQATQPQPSAPAGTATTAPPATAPAVVPTTAATTESLPAAAPTSTPTETPVTTATAVPTTTASTPAASPSPTPGATVTPTPGQPIPSQAMDAATAFTTANGLYQEGLAVKATDVVLAAERFNQAVQLLAGIPAETAAPGISQNAGQLRAEVQAQFDAIARTAALRLRSEAQALFDRNRVADALPIYLRAYAIDPDSYGGGVAYYCGRCYQLLGQPDQARPYYQYVITRFAGRDIATSAAVRLREMGG